MIDCLRLWRLIFIVSSYNFGLRADPLTPVDHNSRPSIHEVNVGETAKIICPSNDDDHLFQYWSLKGYEELLGPRNKINERKYKYEVLSGTLFIKVKHLYYLS